jgi:hypothetical protein
MEERAGGGNLLPLYCLLQQASTDRVGDIQTRVSFRRTDNCQFAITAARQAFVLQCFGAVRKLAPNSRKLQVNATNRKVYAPGTDFRSGGGKAGAAIVAAHVNDHG